MFDPRLSLTRWLAPALVAIAALPAQAGDVGVSIGFSQPGVYGRVDIGRYPQPVLVAPQPVVIGRPVYREPVYLWVPPGHRHDWRRHCGHYRACGAPVYFVQDGWYRQHVIVRRDDGWRREDGHRHHHHHHHHHDHHRDHGRGHRH